MDPNLLEHILNVSRQMAETRALVPLLNYVMDEAIELVGAERGYIVLIRPDRSLDFRVKRGQNGETLEHAEDQISRSILNQVIDTHEPLILRNAMSDPQFGQAESVVILGLRSVMCVPFISRGDTIGAIYVENRSIRGRFSEDNLPPLILFANQAAVAIENAALNDQLEARVTARTGELEQAKVQLEKSWTEAVEANRLRIEWLSKITHDLRASLGLASGTLSVLQEGILGDLTEDQLEWIDKSLDAVLHVKDLTDDLFDLSRLESGGLSLSPQTVDLEDFLQNVYDVGQGLPWSEGVILKLNISSPLHGVTIDPLRIRQVLLNLLSNAHKFTTRGSVTIHARDLADEAKVLIGVSDTGEGIPPDKLDRVFERFTQIDDNTSRRQTGTGLGLAICRELVEMHGGCIWVESTPGVGSNFMFTLPLDSPVPAA